MWFLFLIFIVLFIYSVGYLGSQLGEIVLAIKELEVTTRGRHDP